MDNTFILPIIIFLIMFIFTIIALLILQNKRKHKYKNTIEELDYEKNRLIGVPILSELSKVNRYINGFNYWSRFLNRKKRL